ncbi:MAG: hypothetical protein ACOYOA_10585 [Saprospiraceae bacterium]
MANVNVFFEKNKKQIGIVLGICLLVWGAVRIYEKYNPSPEMSFYYAKSTLDLSKQEEQILLENPKSPLYFHLMDVVWDSDKQFAIPTAQIRLEKSLPQFLTIVPVVNIANEVFEHINSADADGLAQMIAKRIEDKLMEGNGVVNPIQSLQLDCDWTPETKDRYFVFIQSLANSFDFPITVSVRLHQIKFKEKMGIPPVKRVMLFYFNSGELNESKTRNVYSDSAFPNDFLSQIEQYPMPMDLGILLFGCGQIKRNDKIIHLLDNLSKEDLTDNLIFEQISPTDFKVLDDITLKNFRCVSGDNIHLETIENNQLSSTCAALAPHLKREKRNICFYQLDDVLLKNYPNGFLKGLVKVLD